MTAPAVREISADLIDAGDNVTGHQDRESFDPDQLAELAADIATNGLASPPLVRPIGDRYQLVAGERRLRAMRDVLRWPTIPLLVADLDDNAARALMWAENDKRSDLSLREQARAIAARMRDGRSAADVARDMGHRETWARNRLALLELDDAVGALVDSGQLRLERAIMLTDLPHAAQRAAAARAGDASGDVWRAVVAQLVDQHCQASMFSGADYELETQEWDTAAARYVSDADKAEQAAARDDEILGPQELSVELKTSVQTIWKRRSRDRLPIEDLKVSGVPMWRRGTLRRAGILPD
jgi:ParB/RepB/Spo0J family partition protein